MNGRGCAPFAAARNGTMKIFSRLHGQQRMEEPHLGNARKGAEQQVSMLGWVAAVMDTESPSQLRPAVIRGCLYPGCRGGGERGSAVGRHGSTDPGELFAAEHRDHALAADEERMETIRGAPRRPADDGRALSEGMMAHRRAGARIVARDDGDEAAFARDIQRIEPKSSHAPRTSDAEDVFFVEHDARVDAGGRSRSGRSRDPRGSGRRHAAIRALRRASRDQAVQRRAVALQGRFQLDTLTRARMAMP